MKKGKITPAVSDKESGIHMQIFNRQLMWHGMFLFVLGLSMRLLEQRFTNVRMALSAHLEDVMNGLFLIALGSIWSEVRLTQAVKTTAYWIALYGTYANWFVRSMAAAFGTAAQSPIASNGHSGQPWRERLVAFGFLSVAVVMVATSVLVLWGLRQRSLSRSDSRKSEELHIPRAVEGRRS